MTNEVSNWKKPGGKLGMVVLGCIVAGGVMLLDKILPWLIMFTQNTITLIAMIAVLSVMLYVLTQPKTWRLLGTIYFLIMRKLTGLVIEIDPIAIMERHVEEMRVRVEKMRKAMNEMRGLVRRNSDRLDRESNRLQNELVKLKEFRNRGQVAGVKQSEIMVKMLKESVEKRQVRLDTSKKWVEILSKLSEYASIQADYNAQFVELKKEEYEEVKAQHSAFKSALSVLGDSPDALAEYNMALDHMELDMATKLGEMESVLDETGGLLGQIDVEEAITSERADNILLQYERGEGIFSASSWEALPRETETETNNSKFKF